MDLKVLLLHIRRSSLFPSWSSLTPSLAESFALSFASRSLKDFSSICIYRLLVLRDWSAFLLLPSKRAILDFISWRSISHAFRSRSCLCHSVCKKRMTPAYIVNCYPLALKPNLSGTIPCSVYSVPCGWFAWLPSPPLPAVLPPPIPDSDCQAIAARPDPLAIPLLQNPQECSESAAW